MDRPEHDVPRFRRVNPGFEGFLVTHFADQNHIGVFAHRMFQGRVPIDDIEVDFALIDDRHAIREHEFDRVFNRQDVQCLAAVHVVEHRRDRRRFPRTRHARKDNQPLVVVAKSFDGGWQTELLEGRDIRIHTPCDHREFAALFQHVHAEAAFVVADDMGEVGPAVFFHLLTGLIVHDRREQLLAHFLRQHRRVHLLDDAA